MSQTQLVSIVDDDPLAREGIRELVESLGYKARAFVSAQDFLQSGAVATTRCLITDLQMPGLSRLDLQDRLQRSATTRLSFLLPPTRTRSTAAEP